MKIVGYVLAFYLILLSAVPCCAFDGCPDDKTEQTTNHESGDEDCGNCSPFFSCEGCATATIAYRLVSFEFVSLQVLPVYTTYIQVSLPQVNYDFWQPPKIS
jgi:hypothetical protein